MISTRGDNPFVRIVCDVLRNFVHASSLKANCLKSNILLAGMDDLEKSRISTLTGFSHGSMPFRYLAIPSVGVYLNVADYGPLVDKVSNTIQGWA